MSERKLFDDWAETYDESLKDSSGFPFAGYNDVLGTIVGGAAMGAGDYVLDIGIGALAARFAAIVSAYAFYEFELATKLELLARLAGLLGPGGRVVIGDISFETAAARDVVWKEWQRVWDESELDWVAEEVLPLLRQQGFGVHYVQVSFCAGVYTLRREKPTSKAPFGAFEVVKLRVPDYCVR